MDDLGNGIVPNLVNKTTIAFYKFLKRCFFTHLPYSTSELTLYAWFLFDLLLVQVVNTYNFACFAGTNKYISVYEN